MTNFEYLKNIPEFKLFASACTEAERVFSTSAAMCAVGSRKALELAVKWVYYADKTMKMPYRDNIQSLVRCTLSQQYSLCNLYSILSPVYSKYLMWYPQHNTLSQEHIPLSHYIQKHLCSLPVLCMYSGLRFHLLQLHRPLP